MPGSPERPPPAPRSQSAAAVMMVRPACFGFNAQTAGSNAFQQAGAEEGGHGGQQAMALAEFDAVADALRAAGVEVLIAADTPTPVKPDAIFPNNWVSFHHDGTVALYPMLAANRRLERREDLVWQVVRAGGFRVSRTVDFTHHEAQGKFLEGTGSLVLDRVHGVAYACASPRTDLDVLGDFAQQLDYDLVNFEALDSSGQAIYHTNVVMAVGSAFALVCGESIVKASHRAAVFARLRDTGHDIVDISRAQMLKFAGNALELSPAAGGRILVLSNTALKCLLPAQHAQLQAHARLVAVDIPHIETVGGGGVRCMLAEIHLPKS
jgi:hypothetical protein